jgi:cyclase
MKQIPAVFPHESLSQHSPAIASQVLLAYSRLMQILKPAPSIFAFYDGREGASGGTWVDDCALSLGIASYAFVEDRQALVYDTHVSVPHAHEIRAALEAEGVSEFLVVLSHWHLDHIAGTAAFEDCRIIANRKTQAHMERHFAAIEDGTHHGPPAIKPLIMPNEVFEGQTDVMIGQTRIDLIEANIHSDDGTVAWLPAQGMLLAGDTMEDTITYVCEPESFDVHLAELDRLWALNPRRILPNHGDPEIISLGGYERTLIRAQQQYIRMLKRARTDESVRSMPLAELIRGPLEAGWVHMYAPYDAIHKQNLERVLDLKA